MKLNRDFEMAVNTVLWLKKQRADKFLLAADIAKSLGFSVGYMHKVLRSLTMHGIIESKRGRAGGVRLRAQKVTLLDIWNIAFGEIDLKTPSVPQMKKPLKAFTDAMAETVIYKRRDA